MDSISVFADLMTVEFLLQSNEHQTCQQTSLDMLPNTVQPSELDRQEFMAFFL